MKLLIASLFMMSSSAFSASPGYDLSMKLSLNGKHISSPRLIVKAGETAMISQKTDDEESFIEVVASEGEVQKNKGILMKFVIGTVSENGERKVISKAQILAKENEPAQITVGDKTEVMSMTVTAKRKSL